MRNLNNRQLLQEGSECFMGHVLQHCELFTDTYISASIPDEINDFFPSLPNMAV
jgi:hypothetical protein